MLNAEISGHDKCKNHECLYKKVPFSRKPKRQCDGGEKHSGSTSAEQQIGQVYDDKCDFPWKADVDFFQHREENEDYSAAEIPFSESAVSMPALWTGAHEAMQTILRAHAAAPKIVQAILGTRGNDDPPSAVRLSILVWVPAAF